MRQVKDVAAQNVGGHQVGRALHALELQFQHAGQSFGQQGLGDAGHAFEQQVPFAEQGDQHLVDDGGLPDHGLAQFLFQLCCQRGDCLHGRFLLFILFRLAPRPGRYSSRLTGA